MSGSYDKARTSSSGNSPQSSDETSTVKKKSILLNPEYKRGSSKATIQWEESVKGQRLDDRMKLDKKSRLHALSHFFSHGSKWSYIQELVTKLKSDEGKGLRSGRISEEDSQERVSLKRIDSLVRELWHGMLQKMVMKGVDLTLDQQAKLELLKHKIKLENEKYLRSHPELNILLSLVYRKLLREKPEDPKVFVANYVHYLNAHREELVLDEVDVPFDRAPVEVEEPSDDLVDKTQEVEVFVRGLVQKCAEMATCGSAVANVTNIIDSMLGTIYPSKGPDPLSSVLSAEKVVRGILMSMLTSVAQARTKSAEIVAEEVLDSVFENVCPSVSRDSSDFVEMKESVESFIRSLLKTVTERVARQVRRQDRLNRFEKNISEERYSINDEHDLMSITSKSILKKLPHKLTGVNSDLKLNDKPEFKSKVKFQSVTYNKSISKESLLNNKNSND